MDSRLRGNDNPLALALALALTLTLTLAPALAPALALAPAPALALALALELARILRVEPTFDSRPPLIMPDTDLDFAPAQSAVNSNISFLEGGGELGALMRSFDWSSTSLGPPESWPQSLRSAVSILLPSKAQIVLFWGPDLVTLYNDAYRPVFSTKHPRALGLPAREAWSEIWDLVLSELFGGVLRTGEAFWATDRLFILERNGFPEETYFDVSYDPIRDESGSVGGIFCIVSETSGHVVGKRRLGTLRDLGVRSTGARNPREACEASMQALAENQHDIPFAFASLVDRATGTPPLTIGTPGTAVLSAAEVWQLNDVLRDGMIRVIDLDDSHGELPVGAWDKPPRQAVVMPISGPAGNIGVLVAGLSPMRSFDEEYRGFFELIARQLSANLASAKAQEDERLRAESLSQLDRAKTAFFGNVSHEFRTPLTLMLAPLEDALAESDGLSQSNRERLGLAHRSSLRLLRLVNTLLDFSRIEAGRFEAAYERTNIGTFTADLVSVFRSLVERAGLELVVKTTATSAEVYVDRQMWEKIVFNLVSNAFKFTMAGGIEVELKQGDDHVELSVRDTGTGIPAGDLPHLFERFYRVRGAKGRTFEGSGIGLALVRELVRLHGGDVIVRSEEGIGSIFSVVIPTGSAHLPSDRIGASRTLASTEVRADAYLQELRGWTSAEGDAPADPTDSHTSDDIPVALRNALGRPARVLVADDNSDMRDYLRRLLAARYEVEVVSDGEAALNAAREHTPDLIVTDVMMPRLDGFGLMQELRADPLLKWIPVVMLSARAGEEARVEGMGAGADDYIVKPFGARELLARVDARIELSKAKEALREEACILETLNRIGQTIAAELDLQRVVQSVTDAATAVSGAQFGAFFYNVRNASDESYMLFALSGAPREAFERLGMPRNTGLFSATFNAEGPVRLDDVTLDPRYGHNSPHKGMPAGHLPVRSYLAVPVVSRSGEVIGGLLFGHREVGVFTERAERLVTGMASQAAVAIDNARLYERSQQLVAQLQDADVRKDEFLATLSHELRNPLAPLRNSLHLLRLARNTESNVRPIHEVMERQLNHLVRLVDDLLEVSRISMGTFELRRERVGVASIIASAVETSDPLIQHEGHKLTVNLPTEPIWVDGDSVRLAQIFANLLNNAAKYTPRGGSVNVSANREDGFAVVSVCDNGSGISPDVLPRVFEMFNRGDKKDMDEKGGLGIGLALARRLVTMHGGSISGTSAGRGMGSQFTVRLPLASDPLPVSHTEEWQRAKIPTKQILVVDDNRDAADSMGMVLELLGAEVRVAGSGMEALEVLNNYDPAIILLDIGMPVMNGYDVAKEITARFPHRKPLMVALTGWGQDRDRADARAAGFDRHMTKPAEIESLEALLRSI